MRCRLRAAIFVVGLLVLPGVAGANRFDCAAAKAVGPVGPAADRLAAYAYGTVDAYGDLLCFVGDPRCDCLQSITPIDGSEQQAVFIGLWRAIVEACEGQGTESRSFSGIVQEAALELCEPREVCGPSLCAAGEVCCNPSCGICTPPDGACIEIACCTTCDCAVCGSDEFCDDITGIAECLPLPSCASILCEQGFRCELVDVTCIREPCPPQPMCVAD